MMQLIFCAWSKSESTNEDWINFIFIILTCLQVNYTVEFRQTAFTKNQLKKLLLFVDSLSERSCHDIIMYSY